MIFDEVKGKLGFGCMRLPMKGDEVDTEQVSRMADDFLAAGFNYFDTAHGYIGGKSESALRACLTSRYDRSRYVLANKLSDPYFETRSDIRPLFQTQLDAVGVTYFDYYLIHAVGPWNYPKYCACEAFEEACELKKEGLVRHVGLSYHGDLDLFRKILAEKRQYIEFVQLQINYLDYDDEGVQGRKLIEAAAEAGIPVIVMEPVKGGALVSLPQTVRDLFARESMPSEAETALSFASTRPGVKVVLSGMSNVAQMQDNMRIFAHAPVMTGKQEEVLLDAVKLVRAIKLVGCTACRYCCEGCPAHINIPEVFTALNIQRQFGASVAKGHYAYAPRDAAASACLACGACEQSCPQHLPIRDLLKEAVAAIE